MYNLFEYVLLSTISTSLIFMFIHYISKVISKTVSKTTITPTSDQLKSRLKSEPFPSVTWKKISDFTLDLLHVLPRRQCCPKRGSISAILVICPASFGRKNRTSSNWWVSIFPELTAFLVWPTLPPTTFSEATFQSILMRLFQLFFLRGQADCGRRDTQKWHPPNEQVQPQLSSVTSGKSQRTMLVTAHSLFFSLFFPRHWDWARGKSEKGLRKNVELIKKDLSSLFYGRMKVEKIIKKFSHSILGPRATIGGWIGWKWSTVRWCLRKISSFSKNPWGCWSGLGAMETDTETCTGFFHLFVVKNLGSNQLEV